MGELTPEEKISLIKLRLQETLREDIIEDVILNQKRPLVIYWGTATTGPPHCAYLVPMVKIAHFLKAGCVVKILIADLHGYLDNLKASLEVVAFRAEYYQRIITSLLQAIGVSIDKLEFVRGSTYQETGLYFRDTLKLSTVVSQHDSQKAGAEVVKQTDNPMLSGLIYPIMQCLDEEYLGVDAQFGGVDQRKIFTLASELLPKVGFRERAHLMNPMVPGLAGGKMSASDPDSKIDVLETPEGVRKKVKKAVAAPKQVEGNGMISFVEYVLLPVSGLQSEDGQGKFVVERREGEGEPLVYKDIADVKADYTADKLTPQLLKSGVTAALNELLAPIQTSFNASKEWQEIKEKAYPPEEPAKKQKKVKDKGTRFPGAMAQANGSAEKADVVDGVKLSLQTKKGTSS